MDLCLFDQRPPAIEYASYDSSLAYTWTQLKDRIDIMTDEHLIDFQSKLKLTRMQASRQIHDGNLHVESIGFVVHHKDYTV